MHATRTLRLLAGLLAVGIAAAGCTRQGGDPPVRLHPDPPSALVIVSTAPAAESAPIRAAIAGAARTGEHLEVVDPADTAEPVVVSSVAPTPPSLPGPSAPTPPKAGATSYLVHQYDNQRQQYDNRLAAVQRTLRHELASRMTSWSSSAMAPVMRAPAGSRQAASVRAGLSQAESFLASLGQAGVALGARKVIVLISTPGMSGSVMPLPPTSLTGISVILANFGGGPAAEAEWQADLLQAGASRAVVLSAGADSELAAVTAQGLDGQQGPAPAQVRFALNEAGLGPAARATLAGLALQLTGSCAGAPVSILGFADPLGAPAHNARLAWQRAMNAAAYLVSRGVAAGRVSAAGYGSSLPAAPSNARGAQPLDRRAVIVIDPVAGHPGC